MKIQLKNIQKTYIEKDIKLSALNGLDLTVEEGEMLSIMGSSGSGKTTLLQIIAGIDKMTSGEYYADDTPIHYLNNIELSSFRKGRIGMVYQQFELIPYYSLFENVELPLRLQGIAKHERKRIVEEFLEKLNIADEQKKRPDKLSGGQKQRCAIARALAAGSELILADEPTGALDKETAIQVMDILKEINDEGRTIIVVTHDKDVAEYADRIVYLKNGRLSYEE